MIVYILFSETLNKHYVGETQDLNYRLNLHNSGYFQDSFTAKVNDWQVIFKIPCSSRKSARLIEKHIKRMKSRIYIDNLIKYPEMVDKLLSIYDQPGSSR